MGEDASVSAEDLDTLDLLGTDVLDDIGAGSADGPAPPALAPATPPTGPTRPMCE